MKVTAKIAGCEITVDDGNADEPATVRWKDQAERIKDMVEVTTKEVIALHKQQVGDE